MTALQEIAQLKAQLETASAASASAAELAGIRDALAADKAALVSERDALATERDTLKASVAEVAAKLEAAEKVNRDFDAAVETAASKKAVQQLAAVGAPPIAGMTETPATASELALQIRAEKNPAKRAALYAQFQNLK